MIILNWVIRYRIMRKDYIVFYTHEIIILISKNQFLSTLWKSNRFTGEGRAIRPIYPSTTIEAREGITYVESRGNCAEQCSASVIRNYAIRVTAFPLCSIYSAGPCICLGAHVTDDIGEGPGAKGCDSGRVGRGDKARSTADGARVAWRDWA